MPHRAAKLLVVLAVIFLSLAMIGNSMTKPVGRDEHMYCTGAALMAQGKMIYKDFSYAAQLPYHPLICAILFELAGTTHYLLTMRLLSCVCDILVMLCILGIYRHAFKSSETDGTLLALGGLTLYAFNPMVDYANGYAWNHDVVILCVVASFWLFVSIQSDQRSRHWRIAAIGVLLTFATWMRATTALVELLFFIILTRMPARSIKRRFATALPFVLAAALVSIWPLTVVARAPRAFFLNVVRMPMLYGNWLREMGMVHNKVALTRICLTTPSYFFLLVAVFYVFVTAILMRRKLKPDNAPALLLAVLLPVAFFLIAFVPPTMWRQYLAVPVPFLVISLAVPLSCFNRLSSKGGGSRHSRISAVVVGLCALLAAVSNPPVIGRIPAALVPESWVPLHVHRISQDITARTKEPRLVLTLAPLFAIEGGCEIYRELSCGSIIYRAANALSPEDRAITNTAGPETIAELIEERPASAVMLGTERGRLAVLEAPLRAAVGDDWDRERYEFGPTVCFKP